MKIFNINYTLSIGFNCKILIVKYFENDDNSQRWEFLTRVDEFHPEIQPAVEALKKCIEDIAIAKKNALKI